MKNLKTKKDPKYLRYPEIKTSNKTSFNVLNAKNKSMFKSKYFFIFSILVKIIIPYYKILNKNPISYYIGQDKKIKWLAIQNYRFTMDPGREYI